METEPHQL